MTLALFFVLHLYLGFGCTQYSPYLLLAAFVIQARWKYHNDSQYKGIFCIAKTWTVGQVTCIKGLAEGEKIRVFVKSARFGCSIHSTRAAAGSRAMLQISLKTDHKFFGGHNPRWPFPPPPTSLSLCFSPSHTDCLSRSLILQFYHGVSISHFLPHTQSDLPHFCSSAPCSPQPPRPPLHFHTHTLLALSPSHTPSLSFFTSASFAAPFQTFTVALVFWSARVTDTHRGWSC